MDKIRTIHLKLGSKRIVGYKTFMEAVRRNQESLRSVQARATSEKIKDKIVKEACWEVGRLALLLSDDCAIHFSAMDEQVEWMLIPSVQYRLFQSCWTSDPGFIRLFIPTLDGELLSHDMDRVGILNWMLGKAVRRIVIDEFGVYIHFLNERKYVSLLACVVADSNQSFLKWYIDTD